MKATIKTQGQQFSVSEGNVLVVNRYPKTEAGATIEIKEVLSAGEGDSFKVGAPFLSDASVTARTSRTNGARRSSSSKRRSAKATKRNAATARNCL